MFGKTGVTRDLIIGGPIAVGVGLLGWLDIASAPTPDAADASIREFGTLLTVLFGLAAALWWNQSAKVSNVDVLAGQSQSDANALNGAAATFTAASLLCSVFVGSPWGSTGSWLSAINVLLLLLMSGSELRQAVRISLRQRPEFRGVFVAVSFAIAAAAFLRHLWG
jgi:hypothetical protein